jgi:hypothetical protein
MNFGRSRNSPTFVLAGKKWLVSIQFHVFAQKVFSGAKRQVITPRAADNAEPAAVIKPKARLCERWVRNAQIV